MEHHRSQDRRWPCAHAAGIRRHQPVSGLDRVGTRYVYVTYRGERWVIEEASAAERFSRRVAEGATGVVGYLAIAPDSSQFTFLLGTGTRVRGTAREQLMLSNMSGAITPLDPQVSGSTGNATWSPDGRYVIYTRRADGQDEVARIRPGSTSAPEILASSRPGGPGRFRVPLAWSPDGTQILARSTGGSRPESLLVAPDFTSERRFPSRLGAGPIGFSTDGRDVLGVYRNTTVNGAQWQLLVSWLQATNGSRPTSNCRIPPWDWPGSACTRTGHDSSPRSGSGRPTSGCSRGSTDHRRTSAHHDDGRRRFTRLLSRAPADPVEVKARDGPGAHDRLMGGARVGPGAPATSQGVHRPWVSGAPELSLRQGSPT